MLQLLEQAVQLISAGDSFQLVANICHLPVSVLRNQLFGGDCSHEDNDNNNRNGARATNVNDCGQLGADGRALLSHVQLMSPLFASEERMLVEVLSRLVGGASDGTRCAILPYSATTIQAFIHWYTVHTGRIRHAKWVVERVWRILSAPLSSPLQPYLSQNMSPCDEERDTSLFIDEARRSLMRRLCARCADFISFIQSGQISNSLSDCEKEDRRMSVHSSTLSDSSPGKSAALLIRRIKQRNNKEKLHDNTKTAVATHVVSDVSGVVSETAVSLSTSPDTPAVSRFQDNGCYGVSAENSDDSNHGNSCVLKDPLDGCHSNSARPEYFVSSGEDSLIDRRAAEDLDGECVPDVVCGSDAESSKDGGPPLTRSDLLACCDVSSGIESGSGDSIDTSRRSLENGDDSECAGGDSGANMAPTENHVSGSSEQVNCDDASYCSSSVEDKDDEIPAAPAVTETITQDGCCKSVSQTDNCQSVDATTVDGRESDIGGLSTNVACDSSILSVREEMVLVTAVTRLADTASEDGGETDAVLSYFRTGAVNNSTVRWCLIWLLNRLSRQKVIARIQNDGEWILYLEALCERWTCLRDLVSPKRAPVRRNWPVKRMCLLAQQYLTELLSVSPTVTLCGDTAEPCHRLSSDFIDTQSFANRPRFISLKSSKQSATIETSGRVSSNHCDTDEDDIEEISVLSRQNCRESPVKYLRDSYVLERILCRRFRRIEQCYEYLVKWRGHTQDENSWMSGDELGRQYSDYLAQFDCWWSTISAKTRQKVRTRFADCEIDNGRSVRTAARGAEVASDDKTKRPRSARVEARRSMVKCYDDDEGRTGSAPGSESPVATSPALFCIDVLPSAAATEQQCADDTTASRPSNITVGSRRKRGRPRLTVTAGRGPLVAMTTEERPCKRQRMVFRGRGLKRTRSSRVIVRPRRFADLPDSATRNSATRCRLARTLNHSDAKSNGDVFSCEKRTSIDVSSSGDSVAPFSSPVKSSEAADTVSDSLTPDVHREIQHDRQKRVTAEMTAEVDQDSFVDRQSTDSIPGLRKISRILAVRCSRPDDRQKSECGGQHADDQFLVQYSGRCRRWIARDLMVRASSHSQRQLFRIWWSQLSCSQRSCQLETLQIDPFQHGRFAAADLERHVNNSDASYCADETARVSTAKCRVGRPRKKQPALPNASDCQTAPSHKAVASAGAGVGVFLVERILARRFCSRRSSHLFLVKWLGFPLSACTWEPPDNLAECWPLVERFIRDQTAENDGQQQQQECQHAEHSDDSVTVHQACAEKQQLAALVQLNENRAPKQEDTGSAVDDSIDTEAGDVDQVSHTSAIIGDFDHDEKRCQMKSADQNNAIDVRDSASDKIPSERLEERTGDDGDRPPRRPRGRPPLRSGRVSASKSGNSINRPKRLWRRKTYIRRWRHLRSNSAAISVDRRCLFSNQKLPDCANDTVAAARNSEMATAELVPPHPRRRGRPRIRHREDDNIKGHVVALSNAASSSNGDIVDYNRASRNKMADSGHQKRRSAANSETISPNQIEAGITRNGNSLDNHSPEVAKVSWSSPVVAARKCASFSPVASSHHSRVSFCSSAEAARRSLVFRSQTAPLSSQIESSASDSPRFCRNVSISGAQKINLPVADIEAILARRRQLLSTDGDCDAQVLIKWRHFDQIFCTWETASDVSDACDQWRRLRQRDGATFTMSSGQLRHFLSTRAPSTVSHDSDAAGAPKASTAAKCGAVRIYHRADVSKHKRQSRRKNFTSGIAAITPSCLSGNTNTCSEQPVNTDHVNSKCTSFAGFRPFDVVNTCHMFACGLEQQFDGPSTAVNGRLTDRQRRCCTPVRYRVRLGGGSTSHLECTKSTATLGTISHNVHTPITVCCSVPSSGEMDKHTAEMIDNDCHFSPPSPPSSGH